MSECDRFLERLDEGDPAVEQDDHPRACAKCAEQLRVAQLVKEEFSGGVAADVPEGFAARVAYLARLDERNRRRMRAVPFLSRLSRVVVAAVLLLGLGVTWWYLLPALSIAWRDIASAVELSESLVGMSVIVLTCHVVAIRFALVRLRRVG